MLETADPTTAEVREPQPLRFSTHGIFGLINDGANVAQVAAAMDTTCADIRLHIYRAIADLVTRTGLVLDVACTQAHKLVPVIVKNISHKTGLSWVDLLDETECLELIETRAYFRAFRNSSVYTKEIHHDCSL